ncbi:MAG TPA: 4Fe-4S dicluster domain-containing protein [Polyangia bacterium]
MSKKRGKLTTRREVLTLAAASTAGAALSKAAKAAGSSTAPSSVPVGEFHRFGLAIDLDRCLRCQACVVACAAENNVPALGPERAALTQPIHWMDMLIPAAGSAGSELGHDPVPLPCMHCDRPECVKVCPVGATYVADDGVVAQIWDRCIGCRYCMAVCPYGRRYFNWTLPVWPGANPSSANPDVAMRPAGVVEKCTLCQHRIRAVFERARIDDEPVVDEAIQRLPACAATCPARAITFGDLSDPTSALSKLARDPRAVQLLARLGTGPKVFYLRGRR